MIYSERVTLGYLNILITKMRKLFKCLRIEAARIDCRLEKEESSEQYV